MICGLPSNLPDGLFLFTRLVIVCVSVHNALSAVHILTHARTHALGDMRPVPLHSLANKNPKRPRC
jgi:hypothetical protein